VSALEAPTAYGPLLAASDVEASVIEQLRKWLRSYLAEVDRQHAQPVGTLPMPRSWVTSSDVEKMPEDQTPTLIVQSPGLLSAPEADGQGVYCARWLINVGVHLSARGNGLALRIVRLYVLALRALLLQQQMLPAITVQRIDWLGERYDELDSIDDRTVCTGRVELCVQVADVTTRGHGPLEPWLGPETDPGPDSPTWPISDEVELELLKGPLNTATSNPSTSATAGKPGQWLPAGSTPAASPEALRASDPVRVTASPSTAWVNNQHVRCRDNRVAHWNGHAWAEYPAPGPT
jgi:hypothetical protein